MFLGALEVWPDLSRFLQEDIHPELSKENPMTGMIKISFVNKIFGTCFFVLKG